MITYAQNYEDVMLARVFADKKDGFYVDVGAADPVELSVTKWFYDLGWSGMNIEPNTEFFDRLVAARPRDINLNCGVGASVSEATFFEHSVGELSSFDASARGEEASGTARTVAVTSLTNLFNEHCADRVIDFLKVDVEGWESEVLQGLDLKRYRPTVLVIEATLPQTRIESHMDWEPRLLDSDYSFVYFDGLNRFYVANEHADLKEHFKIPLNGFDHFETPELVRARSDAEQRLSAIDTLEHLIRERDAVLKAKDERILGLEAQLRSEEARIKAISRRRVWELIRPKWIARFSKNGR